MTEAADRRRAIVERHVADVVVRVDRLRYFFGGRVKSEAEAGGDLQLGFADGVVRFRVAGDGEHLEVLDEPWRDPFAPPLSPENAEFVETHGAWRLVDVSTEPDYRAWIGQPLASALLTPTTARLETADGHILAVAVDADELSVSSA